MVHFGAQTVTPQHIGVDQSKPFSLVKLVGPSAAVCRRYEKILVGVTTRGAAHRVDALDEHDGLRRSTLGLLRSCLLHVGCLFPLAL